jgi:hypothetical protein
VETESGTVVIRNWGEREKEGMFNAYGISVLSGGKVLGIHHKT